MKPTQKVLSNIAQGSDIIKLLVWGWNGTKLSVQTVVITHSVSIVELEEEGENDDW